MPCMSIARNGERGDVAHSFDWVIRFGCLTEEVEVFELLSCILQKRYRLIERHWKRDACKILRETFDSGSRQDVAKSRTFPTFFFRTANKLPSSPTDPQGSSVLLATCRAFSTGSISTTSSSLPSSCNNSAATISSSKSLDPPRLLLLPST